MFTVFLSKKVLEYATLAGWQLMVSSGIRLPSVCSAIPVLAFTLGVTSWTKMSDKASAVSHILAPGSWKDKKGRMRRHILTFLGSLPYS